MQTFFCDTKEHPDVLVRVDEMLVVGCYELDEATKIKRGSINTIDLSKKREIITKINVGLSGVLDMKVFGSHLLVAESDGCCTFVNLNGFVEESKFVVNEHTINTLSVAESDGTNHFYYSDSEGGVGKYDIEKKVIVDKIQKLHWSNAWCIRDFSTFNNANLTVSGGEDGSFYFVDWRSNNKIVGSEKKYNEGGVACLQSLNENTLLVGTFEGKIGLYDMRNNKRMINSNIVNKESLVGVENADRVCYWKLNTLNNKVLATCMQDGALLFHFDAQTNTLVCEKNLFEAVDRENLLIYHSEPFYTENKTTVACCDFYNNKIDFFNL